MKDQLADDCMDLKVQLVQAKETIKRYETDLESCKKVFLEKEGNIVSSQGNDQAIFGRSQNNHLLYNSFLW